MELTERLGIEVPVVQAGMGGGLSGAELAGAVSRAGGLGTVGILPAGRMREELVRAREIADGRPVSANHLLPFTRRGHVRACVDAGVASVSLFYGFDRRAVDALHDAGILVLHQVGTVTQAKRALAEGADVLVVQGIEAGGHLLAEEPLHQVLPRVAEIAGEHPVLAAGGIADADDAAAARALGAAGVWCGTRFLLTHESAAHPAYVARALGAERTVETKLFGLAWPDRHRVVPNAAVERWGGENLAGKAVAAVNAASRPLARVLPMAVAERMTSRQSVAVPLFGPSAPLAGMPDRIVDAAPLYAGTCAARIHEVVPAADAVAALVG